MDAGLLRRPAFTTRPWLRACLRANHRRDHVGLFFLINMVSGMLIRRDAEARHRPSHPPTADSMTRLTGWMMEFLLSTLIGIKFAVVEAVRGIPSSSFHTKDKRNEKS